MPCHEGRAYISFCIHPAGYLRYAGISGSEQDAEAAIDGTPDNGSTQVRQMVSVPASHSRALHLDSTIIQNWLLWIAYDFFGMQSMMKS